jgi:hypothetical protein
MSKHVHQYIPPSIHDRHGYPWRFTWQRVPWYWFWRRWRGQTWYRGDELYNPYEFQTDLERARDALQKACGK